jgi:hypothetical protein
MSEETEDALKAWIEEHVQVMLDASLDKKLNKLFWAVIVMLVGGVSSIVGFSQAWGKMEEKVGTVERTALTHKTDTGLHMPAETKYETFVPRVELTNLLNRQTEDIKEVKTTMLRIEELMHKRVQ